MARAVLIDLKGEGAAPQKGWAPESVARVLEMVRKASGSQEGPWVCVMCCQSLPSERNGEGVLHAAVQGLHCPERSLEVVCARSTVAALYAVKQKLDEKDISRVQVLLPPQRKAFMRAFVDQLFTGVYQFEFDDLQVNLGSGNPKQQQPGSPSEALPPLTGQDVGRIQREIRVYLESLPALKGGLRILRSVLIPGNAEEDLALLVLQPLL